jgi:hypothetical protein
MGGFYELKPEGGMTADCFAGADELTTIMSAQK